MSDRWKLVAAGCWVVLLLNTAYIATLPSPTLFYMANAVLHLLLGVALVALIWRLYRAEPGEGSSGKSAFVLLGIAGALGGALAIVGNTTPHRWLLWSHIVVSALATLAGLAWLRRRLVDQRAAGAGSAGGQRLWQASVLAAAALAVLPPVANGWRSAHPDPALRIRNATVVPATMNDEGGGPTSPFFPSAAKTNVGGIIPANFFTESETCGECHQDIYRQWRGSAHHFGSFNNQFYRKSIEYMQDTIGTQPSKWCAGCHDHAVFFNGRFEKPIREQIDTEEAQAGLACTSCHAITHVDGSMGNADITVAYPPLHELASSKNPLLRRVNHFLTYLDPGPHRQTFMKPFMRADSAEFCASCHKVHLDVPVNSYRWFRGFNDYDAWQASGVSGQGARSFYYPKESKNCAGCHMPLVDSQDPGSHDGKVHSHRFPGANTALPFVNHDREQLETVEKFLKSGFITVDIFAVSPESETGATGTPMVRRAEQVKIPDSSPQQASTFAVGEEGQATATATIREVGTVAAPLNVVWPAAAGSPNGAAAPSAGSTVRVDVVVRTRTIGHFFPGGTVDAFDVWLELEGRDATGKVVYWSGSVDDEGRGPVEPGAHFYRSYQLDGAGNAINKRNAWQARSVLYVRLIPPGAADVAHYRVHIPADAKGPLKFSARLNYRKFSHYYTQFAYAGQPKPGQSPGLLDKEHNSLEYSFARANIPANVSGGIRGEIPNLPIVTVAEATASLPLSAAAPGKSAAAPPGWRPIIRKEDRERWNDWGIGLLLQGDLKGAEYAFTRVTEAEPGYADGWVNVARALINEGEIDAAKPFLDRALKISPKLGRALFFEAMVDKEAGDYDKALSELAKVDEQYPRDRVVLNQEARVLFLERRYADALKILDRVCGVDPEDVQMHYTAMLCQRALGHQEQAAREAALFRRFKADEASQALTADRRRASPEDNNERQAIHEHDSIALPVAAATAAKKSAVVAAAAPSAPRGPKVAAAPATSGAPKSSGVSSAPLKRTPAHAVPANQPRRSGS